MSAQIKTVGLVINPEKPLARQLADEVRRFLQGRGVRVFTKRGSTTALAEKADLLIVFGGDGTILRLAREINGAETPVLGINAGSLGFLTTVPANEMARALAAVVEGHYSLRVTTMLQATLEHPKRRQAVHYALNDIVIARGATARIVRLEVRIGGDLLTDYVCDGMIFATSAGSTAYSMSAGGPILTPGTDAFVMTPICPHSLTNRSVVIGRSATAQVRVLSRTEELVLTVDGQVELHLRSDDVITLRRSNRQLHLAVPQGYSYFDTLRKKLHWSGSNV